MNPDVLTAHTFSSNNKAMLETDRMCGCFYCLKIFDPSEISEWINDTNGTAVCPYCGVDSVIGESAGYPITAKFLNDMKTYWF